jgi:DNA polymerase
MDQVDVTACERCPALVECRSRIVNGDGPRDADLCLVGEAPGAQEDQEGRPFVGRSGSVLDEVLDEVGPGREAVRVVNCVRCRPPENRDPASDELDNCRAYLERELAAVDPSVVVTLGKVPAEHLLGESVAVTTAAGEVREARVGDRSYRVVVSVHPAATLYDGSQREPFEAALSTAVELAGLAEDADGDGQSRLGEF